jgi:hypothetical protein
MKRFHLPDWYSTGHLVGMTDGHAQSIESLCPAVEFILRTFRMRHDPTFVHQLTCVGVDSYEVIVRKASRSRSSHSLVILACNSSCRV